MKKLILILLSAATLASLVLLIMSFINFSSWFNSNRILFGIMLVVFGGALHRHILKYNETSKD